MKVFAILAIISVCVAFVTAICCPVKPTNPKFGHGPACTPCKKLENSVLPCCEDFHFLAGFGIGPVCTKCSISANPAANQKN